MKLGEIFKGPFKENEEKSEKTIEKAKIGRVTLSEEEKEKIRQEAILRGQDPQIAIDQALSKIEMANARLKDRASDRAIEETEKDLGNAL